MKQSLRGCNWTLSGVLHLCRRRRTFDWKQDARVAFSHSESNGFGETVCWVLEDFLTHLVGLSCLARGTLEPPSGHPLGRQMGIKSYGDPRHPGDVFVVAEGYRGVAETMSSRAGGCKVSKPASAIA